MRRAIAATLLLVGCATIASEAGDLDAVRPNAGAGPFRVANASELGHPDSPYLLRLKARAYREPTALALDDSGVLGPTALYVVAEVDGVHGIYRFVAADGRSFRDPDPETPVLAPSEVWEGAALSAPEVARVGGEIWMYYAAEGGIGLARSSDGIAFDKLGPVLDASGAAAWEGLDPPQSPGFVALEDGSFALFYAASGKIGEARSLDGQSFQRQGEPVLEPSATEDAGGVFDPEPVIAKSAEGRRILRLYYTGAQQDGATTIGLGARFGQTGRLTRAYSPALSTSRHPGHPSVMTLSSLSLLYFSQQAGTTAAQDYPAIALAVAPATRILPPPISSDDSGGF